MKQCCECKEQKDLSEFNKFKHSPDGFNWYCRLCINAIRRSRGYSKRYREANKHKHAADESKRRYHKTMSAKANDDSVRQAYEACDFINMMTGEWHEVDHIIPLIHKDVCGLHVSHNLQILTRHENRTKRNTFIPA